jgi:hypothetical protein
MLFVQGSISSLSLKDISGLLKFIVMIDLNEAVDDDGKVILVEAIAEVRGRSHS